MNTFAQPSSGQSSSQIEVHVNCLYFCSKCLIVASSLPEIGLNVCLQDKEVNGDHPHASSSGMIEFELSDGHPYDPVVPISAYDDRYVEYQLDDLTGFPCNAEEEEKVLYDFVNIMSDQNLSLFGSCKLFPVFQISNFLFLKDENEKKKNVAQTFMI